MAKQRVGSVPAKCVRFPPLCLLCYSPETRKSSVQPWAERSPPAKTPKAVSHHWQFLEQTRLRGEPRECCKSGLRHIGRALWESLPGVCLLLAVFLSAFDASFSLRWSTAPSHPMLITYWFSSLIIRFSAVVKGVWKQTEHEHCTNLLRRAAADSPLQEWLVNLLQPVVLQKGQCSSPALQKEALGSSHLHLLPLEAATTTMQNGSQQKKPKNKPTDQAQQYYTCKD